MDREIKFFTVGLVFVSIFFLIAARASILPTMQPDGIAWEAGISKSNAERADFISIRERGLASDGWMMESRHLACASCHGLNEHSNIHTMGMMTTKEIRWSALQNEFDAEKFHMALTKGQTLEDAQLNADIPRWKIGNNGKSNLFAYIKTLP